MTDTADRIAQLAWREAKDGKPCSAFANRIRPVMVITERAIAWMRSKDNRLADLLQVKFDEALAHALREPGAEPRITVKVPGLAKFMDEPQAELSESLIEKMNREHAEYGLGKHRRD